MRLFAAVAPPADAVAHLAARIRPLADRQLTWSESANWHITLAFYGEVDDARVPELTERLRRGARRHQALRLTFSGAGRFGSAVLWIGVRGDLQQLRRLAQSAIAAGRRMGIEREPSRSFRPHVTVARSSSRLNDLRPHAAVLSGYTGPTWSATEMVLVRSYLRAGPGGRARHEPIATFPLRAQHESM